MKERWKLLLIVLIFGAAYYVPWSSPVIRRSGLEAFMMLQEYARDHVLTCLIPAFFIAGAISVFVSQASVLKYFGATARKVLLLFGGFGFGNRTGGLFLHRAAALCGHLYAGCGDRPRPPPSSIRRPAINVLGHRAYGPYPGMAAGIGTGHRRGSVCGNHRPSHGLHLSKR